MGSASAPRGGNPQDHSIISLRLQIFIYIHALCGELCAILDNAIFVCNFGQFSFANYSLIFQAIHARMVSFDQASLIENAASQKSNACKLWTGR